MSSLKWANALSLRPTSILWVFMFLVLFTTPFFPGPGSFGFHSVEYSFFAFAFLLMWLCVLFCIQHGIYRFKSDSVLYFCLVFLVIAFMAVPDAQSKPKAILYAGQYIPYMFLMYLTIVLVDDQKKLNYVLDAFTVVALIYSLVTIVAAIKFNNRAQLDEFLVDYFLMETTKTLSYKELVFCVIAYRIFNDRATFYSVAVFIIWLIESLLSGSRGNMLMIFGILFLVFIRGRLSTKKILFGSISVVLLATVLLSVEYVRQRAELLVVTNEESFEEKITAFSRLYTMKIAANIMQTHPINGVGMGNMSYFTEQALRQDPSIPPQIIEYWENNVIYETLTTPMKLGAETGVAGFLFFFVFYFYLWRRVRKALHVVPPSMRVDYVGMEIFVVASFVHNFTDICFMNYYTWLFYGLVIAAHRIVSRGDAPLPTTEGTSQGEPRADLEGSGEPRMVFS